MEGTDREVLVQARAWCRAGHRVTLVTVARTWGSSPRPVGAMAALRDDGRLTGSVSGGCVEEDLVARLVRQPPAAPTVTTYGVTQEQAGRFGLPCGGRLELVLEPATGDSLDPLLAALERRELTLRRVDLLTGLTELLPAGREVEFGYDGRKLEKVFGPTWRLVIVGANHLARYLAEMARALDYQVIVCDPRPEAREAFRVAGVELDGRMPDDAVLALADDPRSAVVTVTHDPRIDDMALMVALDSQAFYIGSLGSRVTNDQRRERLAQLEVSEQGLARLRGPVGLAIGSRTPPEIAISILAELTAVRRGAKLGERPAENPPLLAEERA